MQVRQNLCGSMLVMTIDGAKPLRKQYHFRPSKNGLYAWDIDILIELTKNFNVKTIPLSQIKEYDENWWFENVNDIPSCRAIVEHFKLVNECDLSYPIILSSNGRIMDGMHRVCKAYLEDRETIDVVQFEVDPEPTYVDIQDVDLLPYD